MTDDGAAASPLEPTVTSRDAALDARIALLRDEGASWIEIQREFDLTRQQARYAYQRGKREERRALRRLK